MCILRIRRRRSGLRKLINLLILFTILADMIEASEKINFLKEILEKKEDNFADSFKQDIIMYFDDDFTISNKTLSFLDELNSFEDIEQWVNSLTSKFVLKFDSEVEQENDFIFHYINS